MLLKKFPEDFVVTEIPIDFSGSGDFLIVKVVKKCLNTEDVAQLFAKAFGIPRKFVSYAGTKDKQAVTTQYFSLKNVREEKVARFSHEDVTLEVVGFHKIPLSLGDLRGNRFDIVVRGLEKPLVPKEEIRNFFGEQRFGRNNVAVGRALVKKEFVAACKLLGLPTNNPIEQVKKVPKHTLLLLVHSYQSWLWNTVLEHLDDPPETLPLIGFGTDLDEYSEEVQHQYTQLLSLEEISPREFIIRQLPGISPEGAERQSMIKIEDLTLGEFVDGVQKVSFTLPKGSYATVVVKELSI